jgi:hypothetical protein
VGRARLAEEAWWRYGRELQRRQAGAVLLGVLDALILPVFTPLAMHQAFGRFVPVGESVCAACETTAGRYTWREFGRGRLSLDAEGRPALCLWCVDCGVSEPGAGLTLTGANAERAMRRFLAHAHFAGASRKLLGRAADAIDAAGSAGDFVRAVARDGPSLWQLEQRSPRSLALEIAFNDDAERRLLRGEAEAVERQWEEEERIAAIADGELVFLPRES